MILRRWILWVPLVMSTYPVLLLAAGNDPAEVQPQELLFLVVMSAALTSVVILVSLLLFRDAQKAAAVGVIFVVAFFSYGYLIIFIRSNPVGDFVIGRHRYVLPALFVGSMLLTGAIWRCKKDLSRVLVAVGGAALILTLFNAAQIVQGWSTSSPNTAGSLPGTPNDLSDLPDVYWLIFDSYGREDVIAEYYDIDNGPFLDALRSQGFYVADEARANYMVTARSLPATMSMNHIAKLSSEERDRVQSGRSALDWDIDSTTLGATVNTLGYDIHSFNARTPSGFVGFSLLSTNFLDTTVFQVLRASPVQRWLTGQWAPLFYTEIEGLIAVADDPNPTFSFSYNLPPHDPFIFHSDGTAREDIIDHYELGYGPAAGAAWADLWSQQLEFVNALILETVESILSKSETQPIIVIQSDHGPSSVMMASQTVADNPRTVWDDPSDADQIAEHSPILNTILVPEHCRDALYPTLSPVNTFRLIFDSCLGSSMGLLDDTTYWGGWGDVFIELDAEGVAVSE